MIKPPLTSWYAWAFYLGRLADLLRSQAPNKSVDRNERRKKWIEYTEHRCVDAMVCAARSSPFAGKGKPKKPVLPPITKMDELLYALTRIDHTAEEVIDAGLGKTLLAAQRQRLVYVKKNTVYLSRKGQAVMAAAGFSMKHRKLKPGPTRNGAPTEDDLMDQAEADEAAAFAEAQKGTAA